MNGLTLRVWVLSVGMICIGVYDPRECAPRCLKAIAKSHPNKDSSVPQSLPAESLFHLPKLGLLKKCSMFYAIINYQFKTSELKNVEKLVKQRNVHFCTICEIIFLVYRVSVPLMHHDLFDLGS